MVDQSSFKKKTISVAPARVLEPEEREVRKPQGALAHYKDLDKILKLKKVVAVSNTVAKYDSQEVQKG